MSTSVEEKVARLEAEIEALKAGPQGRPRKRFGRRPLALVAIAVLGLGTLAGVSVATGSTTDVSIITLSPGKNIESNATVGAKKTLNPVVIGGNTTVPSDATTVMITMAVKGVTAGGVLNFYPTGNPAGASGQALAYAKGQLSTMNVTENVGQSGELTIYNNGSGSAIVGAQIVGYSTQVTAADVSGRDGQPGQFLVNNGTAGSMWSTQGQAFAGRSETGTTIAAGAATTVDSTTVTAGTYHVVDTFNATSIGPGLIECWLVTPGGNDSDLVTTPVNAEFGTSSTYFGAGTIQMLARLTGGTLSVQCWNRNASGYETILPDNLIATQVTTASGSGVVN